MVILSAKAARADAYGLEGLTRTRAKMDRLVATRTALRIELQDAKRLEDDPGGIFEEIESWRPR